MNHHVLAVPDKTITAAFFINILGFKKYFENEGWIFVLRDNCEIMLGECRDAIPPSALGEHSYFSYLLVDNADEYFNEVKQKGGTFTSEISDKPWNMREFGILSPDGFRLMVGQKIK